MTPAERRLLHPPEGGAIEAACKAGVDVSLLIERLRLAPEERIHDLQQVIDDLEEMIASTRSHDSA